MRSFIVMGMFVASLAHASWSGYTEVRDLSVEAQGISTLEIEAGAGSLSVDGVEGLTTINVTAEIGVDTRDEERAHKLIEKHLVLDLERRGDKIDLRSDFRNGMWGIGAEGWVKLVVQVPAGLDVVVDDGSGSIVMRNTIGDVRVDDGSGSLKIDGAANVRIDDGSGSIEVSNATGDVRIVDGSGSITVRRVGGSVTIDDGSGSINVDDIGQDLVIEDDGSGGLSVTNVRGEIRNET